MLYFLVRVKCIALYILWAMFLMLQYFHFDSSIPPLSINWNLLFVLFLYCLIIPFHLVWFLYLCFYWWMILWILFFSFLPFCWWYLYLFGIPSLPFWRDFLKCSIWTFSFFKISKILIFNSLNESKILPEIKFDISEWNNNNRIFTISFNLKSD